MSAEDSSIKPDSLEAFVEILAQRKKDKLTLIEKDIRSWMQFGQIESRYGYPVDLTDPEKFIRSELERSSIIIESSNLIEIRAMEQKIANSRRLG